MLKIKELREARGIAQRDIAEKLGVSIAVLSNWERGRNEPSCKDIVMLSDMLSVTTDYLLGRENKSGLVVNNGIVLSQPENELLTLYRRLSPMEQGQVVGFAKSFVM